jgi:hypothetical protein
VTPDVSNSDAVDDLARTDIAIPIDVPDSGSAFDAFDAGLAEGAVDAPVVNDVIEERCPRTCASFAATCGTLRDNCVGVARCGAACVDAATAVRLDVRRLGYDRSRDILYASVGTLDPTRPDTFVLLDPESGAVRFGLAIGPPVDALEMAYDAPWVAYGTPWRISWYAADAGSFGYRGYNVGSRDGTERAAALAPMFRRQLVAAHPGDGSMGCTLTLRDVSALDVVGPRLEACPASFTTVDASVAYGIAPAPSGPQLQIVQVLSSGIASATVPFDSTVTHSIHSSFAFGRLYTTAGPVYDVTVRDRPVRIGSLPLAGGVAVDESLHVALVFGTESIDGNTALVWRAFDADTLAPLFDDGSSIPIGPAGYVDQLVSTGSGRYAAVVYPDGPSSPAMLYVLHLPLGSSVESDAGVDASRTDASSDVTPCWWPDAGPYDPADPTSEAQYRVRELARAAAEYIAAQPPLDAGGPFISSVPRTPTPIRSECAPDPAGTWGTTAWTSLGFGFAAGESHRYSYELDAIGVGNTAQFTARAIGDLDNDGVYSTFEVSGGPAADGGTVVNDLWIWHALE